ncbi:MAG TPA: hypothetical protein VNP95_09390, partial [Thermomicrobiales bacterium]|nr:hypothetical protein [Thermomicrobiales bacterium]
MMDFGNDGAERVDASLALTPSDPRTRVLVVEDDARFAAPLTEAIAAVGLEPLVIGAIDDD